MKDHITIFHCEDNVDGIFTAIYEAWDSGLGLRNVTVQAGENQNLQLFADYRCVETDHGKASRVADTIRRRMGTEDYEILYQAALSNDPEKAEVIFQTMVLGLAVLKRKNITRDLREPYVMKAFELARSVWTEAHRYRMFVRFHELENRVMFSEIEPQYHVLSLLGDHFSDRFPMMNFMIYDRTHRDCLVHQEGKRWVVLEEMDLDEQATHNYSQKEREYAQLWRGFVKSIAIEERKNPRCQMNFMPRKYWKHMTEHEV